MNDDEILSIYKDMIGGSYYDVKRRKTVEVVGVKNNECLIVDDGNEQYEIDIHNLRSL